MRKKKGISLPWKLSATSKLAVMVLAIAVVLCTTVGGTYAWMMAKTDSVVNTFVFGNIDLTLTETDTGDGDGDENTNTYNLMPGAVIGKDPKVTVAKGSEDCWVFVKLEKSENFNQFLEYQLAEGWTSLGEEYPDIYYMEWTESLSTPVYEYGVLKDDVVNVKGEVTAQMIQEVDKAGAYPTLTITAYAVQRDTDVEEIDTAVEAWALIQEESNNQ